MPFRLAYRCFTLSCKCPCRHDAGVKSTAIDNPKSNVSYIVCISVVCLVLIVILGVFHYHGISTAYYARFCVYVTRERKQGLWLYGKDFCASC